MVSPFPPFPTDVSFNDTLLIYCPPHDREAEGKMLGEGRSDIEPVRRRGRRQTGSESWFVVVVVQMSSTELIC